MAKQKFNEQEREDRDEAKRDMKMYLALDWDLKGETPEYFLLKKNTSTTSGHIWTFLLTFWFTLGIGNLVYYLLCMKSKKVIK
jgi:hypothetical protein